MTSLPNNLTPPSTPAAMPHVIAYTDGACSGNPGPGGWGVLLMGGLQQEHRKELCGGEAGTTNNRMEMMAVIQALESLKQMCSVDIYTDSQYVQKGLTEWIKGWKARGWRTADKKPVKNEDLWRRLDAVSQQHNVRLHWVKGHAGDPGNEAADRLARQGITKI